MKYPRVIDGAGFSVKIYRLAAMRAPSKPLTAERGNNREFGTKATRRFANGQEFAAKKLP
jgi:hypothetical protein